MAEEVIQAYIENVYFKFGGSLKILSDDGTEFKNKILEQISKELGLVLCKVVWGQDSFCFCFM